MKQHVKHYSIAVIALFAIVIAGAAVFVYSGVYNIGADDHHTRPVFALMQTLRERSIHVRSEDIQVPNLDDPQLILKGAGQYAAMCTDCHLKPGMSDSEIRPGLYPQPPNLSQVRVDPKDAFWIIKHGIKMSAMPAWGSSHDDPTIWSMVAFLQKLPDMTPEQYKAMVAKAPPDEDMDMGKEDGGHTHSHGGEEAQGHHQGEGGSMEAPEQEDAHSHADAHASTAPAKSMDGYTPRAAPDAEAAAQAFHGALEHGDRTIVLGLLAADATISEGGSTQSREAYAAHHLDEDLAFLKQAKVVPLWMGSMPMGDTAMVASDSRILTIENGKPVAIRSKEQLTLKKIGSAWKITAVQWHSAQVETPQ
ncbi:MAG TPA: c-type cytochrome [Frateuria sp.]|uniref:c-type cytochrome n=1 Tax=Frateuria sp. TaxID=2211372 RepID=UPI002D803283|nr:c-type cytochrome [Frateuria sp.]HET6806268.1 c-type cytochrome [Frateuria sp.]